MNPIAIPAATYAQPPSPQGGNGRGVRGGASTPKGIRSREFGQRVTCTIKGNQRYKDTEAISPKTRRLRQENLAKFRKRAGLAAPADTPPPKRRPLEDKEPTRDHRGVRGGFRSPLEPFDCKVKIRFTVSTNFKGGTVPDKILVDWKQPVEFSGSIASASEHAPRNGLKGIKGRLQCGVPSADFWHPIDGIEVDEDGQFRGCIPDGELPNVVQMRTGAKMRRGDLDPIHLRAVFWWYSSDGRHLTSSELSEPISAKTARQLRNDIAPSDKEKSLTLAMRGLREDPALLAYLLTEQDGKPRMKRLDEIHERRVETSLPEARPAADLVATCNEQAASFEDAADLEGDTALYVKAKTLLETSAILMESGDPSFTHEDPCRLPTCQARLGGILLKIGNTEDGKLIIRKAIDGLRRVGTEESAERVIAAESLLLCLGAGSAV